MPARARLARASASISWPLVDADRLLDLGRQHFEQPAGAGADVEQPPHAGRQVMAEGLFDLAVGDVEGAQFVPALGIVAEEAGGGPAALLDGVEPGTVSGDARVLGSSRRTNSRTRAASSPPLVSRKRVN